MKYDVLKFNSHTSEDDKEDSLLTYKKHPCTTQFELAEGMKTFQNLDCFVERSHRNSTCKKYSKNCSKIQLFFFFLVIISVS